MNVEKVHDNIDALKCLKCLGIYLFDTMLSVQLKRSFSNEFVGGGIGEEGETDVGYRQRSPSQRACSLHPHVLAGRL